jgi:hypothetical protein
MLALGTMRHDTKNLTRMSEKVIGMVKQILKRKIIAFRSTPGLERATDLHEADVKPGRVFFFFEYFFYI